MTVSNNNGQTTVINVGSLALYMNDDASKAAATFAGKALAKPGLDSLSISSEKQEVSTIESKDSPYYLTTERDEQISENIVRMHLTIETADFKDGKKWRFYDGGSSVAMTIEDEVFLQRVENGEPFRKGDTVECDVRLVQKRSGLSIRESARSST